MLPLVGQRNCARLCLRVVQAQHCRMISCLYLIFFFLFFFSISRDVWTLSRCVLSSRVPESTQLECRREPASFLPVQTVNGEIMLFICYIHFPKPPPISVLSVLHTLSDHNL